ncbi:serine hydrolase [Nakamurella sp. YIM 132087]|uniref:Serine hydrolase n=2 Tax=Nakamurella alba TaxID=2665158 RepID=A0A7K1FSS2_9ACTN|nr:serine hydrolase [Nakamurella alba]
MVEAATGGTYPDALQKYVLDPLGLENTSLPSEVALPEPFIHGYDLTGTDPMEDVTEGLAPGWAWASGGVVSTPADLNTFVRGYVSGELYSAEVRAEQQKLFIPGGESGPPGPGLNSASLSLFRYQTECGTVYGHTGNTVGYTQFIAASPDGTRSVTVSINLQRTDHSEDQAAFVFDALQRAELAGVCMALQG